MTEAATPTREHAFESRLYRPPGVGTWTFAMIDPGVVRAAGLRSHARVVGTLDGVPFRSSVMPRGGGKFFVVVPSEIRDRIGKAHGAKVRIVLRVDPAPVRIEVPADLQRALRAAPKARKFFEALAPSHRKYYVQWVTGAVRPETRARRVAQAVAMLSRGEKRS